MLSSRRRALAACVVVAAALASNGCGYALAGRGNFLPSYIRTIGIPTFENHTSLFQMAQLVTDKVRTEFIGRGNYKVVPEVFGADAVLVGAVTNVTIIPTNFGEQAATRYTITVTANIQLRDVQKDTILWSNPAISLREEYDATSSVSNDPTGQVDPSSFFTQESNALERISDEFSRSVVSAILEAF
jgi:Lipopolysaccharide-assembly